MLASGKRPPARLFDKGASSAGDFTVRRKQPSPGPILVHVAHVRLAPIAPRAGVLRSQPQLPRHARPQSRSRTADRGPRRDPGRGPRGGAGSLRSVRGGGGGGDGSPRGRAKLDAPAARGRDEAGRSESSDVPRGRGLGTEAVLPPPPPLPHPSPLAQAAPTSPPSLLLTLLRRLLLSQGGAGIVCLVLSLGRATGTTAPLVGSLALFSCALAALGASIARSPRRARQRSALYVSLAIVTLSFAWHVASHAAAVAKADCSFAQMNAHLDRLERETTALEESARELEHDFKIRLVRSLTRRRACD